MQEGAVGKAAALATVGIVVAFALLLLTNLPLFVDMCCAIIGGGVLFVLMYMVFGKVPVRRWSWYPPEEAEESLPPEMLEVARPPPTQDSVACRTCGAELRPNANFCAACGSLVGRP